MTHPTTVSASATLHRLGSERAWSEWILPIAVCTLATLKTLRLPSTWATSQALIDYSEGFVKRGLPGQLYRALHWTGFAALQRTMLAEVALLLLALLALGLRSRVGRWCGNLLVPAVFLGSYALSFLVHMVGYADLINITLTIAVLLVRPPLPRLALALPACAVAILAHESFLLTQFPVLLLPFVLDALQSHPSSSAGRPRSAWLRAGVLAAFAVTLTAFVSTRGLLTPAKAEAMHQAALRHHDLPVQSFAFTVLSRTFAENRTMTVLAHNGRTWKTATFASRFAIAPPAALLLLVAWRALAGQRRRRLLWALLVAASACPLGMHLLGFDAARWNVLCLVNLYLGLCVLALHLPTAPRNLPPAETYASVLVLALGMASGYGLFDDESINPYPYLPVLRQHYSDYKAGAAQERQLQNQHTPNPHPEVHP